MKKVSLPIFFLFSNKKDKKRLNQDFFVPGYDLDHLKGIQKQKVKQRM